MVSPKILVLTYFCAHRPLRRGQVRAAAAPAEGPARAGAHASARHAARAGAGATAPGPAGLCTPLPRGTLLRRPLRAVPVCAAHDVDERRRHRDTRAQVGSGLDDDDALLALHTLLENRSGEWVLGAEDVRECGSAVAARLCPGAGAVVFPSQVRRRGARRFAQDSRGPARALTRLGALV